MNNLHISLNEISNASRILKQARTMESLDFINEIFVVGLHAAHLKTEERITENVTFHRISLKTRALPKGLLFQVLKYMEYICKVCFFYRNKNIKIINIHAVSVLPLGVLLKFLYGAKLIYDTHELETEQGEQGLRKKLSKILERRLIKYCDQVFVVSENIADWYRDEYSISRPVVVFNAPLKVDVLSNDKFRQELGISPEQIIFLYQGGLIKERGIELIIKTFEKLVDTNAVIVFMGYGELEGFLIEKSELYKNIYYMPAVSPDNVLSYTSSADFGIHVIENTCLNHNFCMPNKLFEYAMAGLPVVVSDVKEMREFVEKHKMGIALQAYTVGELLKVIKSLLSQDVSQMKKTAKKAALENSWEVQEVKMLDVYKKMLGS